MMIPGLSGGSVALMLGIYYLILNCTAKPNIKNIKILIWIGSGACLGLLLISIILTYIINNSYFSFLVYGIVFATIFVYFKNLKKEGYIFIIIGALIAYLINIIPNIEMNYNLLILGSIEALLAIGLILPGISFSYLLVTFNLYDKIIQSINDFDILFLLLFIVILLFWILVFSKLISYFVDKHLNQTNGLITGFLLFSISEINVNFYSINIYVGLIIFIVGFMISLYLLKK